jgi:nucleoside phosphorylase
VGVLGIASEVAPIEKRLQDSRDVAVRGYVFRAGTLNGRQVVVGRSGAEPRIVEGVIVTGDTFLSDMAHREALRSALGAAAVKMEGAAVVQTCRQFSVSCLVIRSITDRADGQAQTSYEQFLATASENAATLVAAIIAGLEERAR